MEEKVTCTKGVKHATDAMHKKMFLILVIICVVLLLMSW